MDTDGNVDISPGGGKDFCHQTCVLKTVGPCASIILMGRGIYM